MISTTYTILFLLLVHTLGVFVSARDTITTGDFIRDINGENITSAGKIFTLGFFGNYSDSRRYIGIWYCKDPNTVVWVANREEPLPNRTGIFTIADQDGQLKVMDENNRSYFSTQVASSQLLPRTVKLRDSGNLVMTESGKMVALWQSFYFPTDTFLPGMQMNENLKLTSWKSPEDPGSGDFTFQQDEEGNNRYKILKKERAMPYWRSRGGSLPSFFNPDKAFVVVLSAFLLPNSDNRSMRNYKNVSVTIQESQNTRVVMNSSGEIQYISWNDRAQSWFWQWSEPEDQCGVYKVCGKFGSCSVSKNEFNCTCLQGFERTSSDDFSNGCTRVSKCSKNDTFSKLNVLKVENPDVFLEAESEEKCIEECLKNCDCQAYYPYVANESDAGIEKRNSRQALPDGRERNRQGCWIWNTELVGLREGYGHNISIRISVSDTEIANATRLEGSQHKTTSISLKAMVITIIVTVALLLLCSISYISYRRIVTRRQESRESIHRNPALHLYDSERRRDLIDPTQFTEDDKKSIDVPFFNLESILVVTDNFSNENKLGQGGFGPVYKGKFPGGQEIAVKRLSSHSLQGLEELKNEVMLIAKLQHRNLVRLLGYCIEGDEKILLYEYMRNKSLDAFIFDRTLCILLDWGKRFDIILGIARGLLYLHQDSRLRVIHRDLKVSNILLDEDMNPKISDFGLARIVGGRETEASTNRVVGTYGYMSPEYALDGLFSIKSDVFSFGVVVLEIISGKRNTGFYESQQALNLLGYAWSLWKEERALILMDHTLAESCNKSEVLKCIIVGLLCVQEDPEDRPTMSNIVFMLGSETETLPNPKQPAFVARKRLSSTPSSSSSKPEMLSINELSISKPEGR